MCRAIKCVSSSSLPPVGVTHEVIFVLGIFRGFRCFLSGISGLEKSSFPPAVFLFHTRLHFPYSLLPVEKPLPGMQKSERREKKSTSSLLIFLVPYLCSSFLFFFFSQIHFLISFACLYSVHCFQPLEFYLISSHAASRDLEHEWEINKLLLSQKGCKMRISTIVLLSISFRARFVKFYSSLLRENRGQERRFQRKLVPRFSPTR